MLPAKRVYATEYENVEMVFNFDDETGNLSSITVKFNIRAAGAAVADGKWGIGIFECDFTDDDNEKNRVKNEYGLTDINVISNNHYVVNAYNAARVAPSSWDIGTVCTTPYTVNKSALMPLPVAYGAGEGAWAKSITEHHESTIDMSGAKLEAGKTYYAHIMMNNGYCWFVESSGTKRYSGNTFSLDTLHTHNYVYGVSDNELYAYCDASKAHAYCDNYGVENKVSITLSAENRAYSGSPYSGASLGDTSVWSGLGFAVPTIEYVGRGSTTYNKSIQPPSETGTYTACISAGDYTATKDFEITKCEQNATVTVSGYTYGGSVSTPSISDVKEDAVPTYYYNSENSNKNGIAWSELTPTTLTPGTYYVYATLPATRNYNAYTTPAKSFTVSNRTISDDNVTMTGYNGEYNGKEHSISVAVSDPADAVITYSDAADGTYTAAKPMYKNVGNYTVYYKIDKQYYDTKTGSGTVNISQKEVGLDWGNTSFTYDGEQHLPNVSAIELIDGDNCTVTVEGAQSDANAKSGTGSYTATATALDNDNYKLPASGNTKEFTIAPKEIGITWGNTTFDYNGSEQVPSATATNLIGGDSCTLTVSGAEKNVSSSNYTATVTGVSNTNYKLPETGITTDFTIKPIAMSVSSHDENHVYDGNEYSIAVNVTLPNKASDDVATIKYGTVDGVYNLEESPKRSAYGTTEVYYKVTSPNYTTAFGHQKIDIGKQAITGVSAEGKNVPYDGGGHSINVSNPADTTVSYKTDSEAEYGANNPTFKDAGSYTVYYKVSKDDNYSPVEGQETVVITQKEVEVAWEQTTLEYNGIEQGPIASVAAGGLVAGDTCDISIEGKSTNAGTGYTATAVSASNANYKLTGELNCAYSILPKPVAVNPDNASKHIGKNDPALTFTATGLVDGDELTDISLIRDTGEKAGQYSIRASMKDGSNSNYNVDLTQVGVFTIENHDWSGAWKTIKEATDKENGLKEKQCMHEGCTQKMSESIPATGGGNTDIPFTEPDAGDIVRQTEVDPKAPVESATFDNSKTELVKKSTIFDDDDFNAIKSGDDARVWLEISDKEESSIASENIALIKETAEAALSATNPQIEYFDANMYKRVGSGPTVQITEPGCNIRIRIVVPEKLINKDKDKIRTYKVVRLHNEEATVVEGQFNEQTRELSFDTDGFSTYAIAFKDKYVGKPTPPKGDPDPNPDPGNNNSSTPQSGSVNTAVNPPIPVIPYNPYGLQVKPPKTDDLGPIASICEAVKEKIKNIFDK